MRTFCIAQGATQYSAMAYRGNNHKKRGYISGITGLSRWLSGQDPPAVQETQVRSLGWEDPLEEEMATHSSILA